MNDEAILIVVLLLGVAVMIVGLVLYQRGKEARLAALPEIEIPIESVWRSVLVVLPSVVVGPVLVGVLAAATDPWARGHALVATLIGIAAGAAGLIVGLRLFRRFRRIGLLRSTPVSLDLELGDERWQIDLNEPYQLDEASASGPTEMPVQVLCVSQGDQRLGFSYMLTPTRKPAGDRSLDHYLPPLLGGETRVIHDRLRAQLRQAATR